MKSTLTIYDEGKELPLQKAKRVYKSWKGVVSKGTYYYRRRNGMSVQEALKPVVFNLRNGA